jgi:HD-GYP domain-containing protein (c-di-GMP phosphodiesterase class II)
MKALNGIGLSGLDDAGIVRRLVVEFGAPIGLFDVIKGSWLRRSGAPDAAFPEVAREVAITAVWVGTAESRATLWRPEEAGVVWLVLPVKRGPDRLVAVAGFKTSEGPTGPVIPSAKAGGSSSLVRWGPVCPEPALRAWGQQVIDQIQRESAIPQSGGDMLLVARLIRRLRISESTEKFQQLATHALRAAMNVQALAWVPCHHADPVVVNGDCGTLKSNELRNLIPDSAKASPRIDNVVSGAEPMLKRVIAVASDTSHATGWLIAINPLDGRSFAPADADLLQPVASLLASQQNNARVYADLKDLLFGVIRALTAAIDAKDPYTSGHSERVARIAVRLATELGMPANQRGDLYLMGLLHDVGKIGVDDSVLKKSGPLTPEEYRKIQSHVEIGVLILNDLKKLNHLLPGVRYHHESYDGSGYPTGLAAEAIPFEARILAVADSFDAMSSTRPYRRRLTPMQIDDILRKGSGSQWDPKVVEALFACRMDLEMIRQKGLGESLQLAVTETLGRN